MRTTIFKALALVVAIAFTATTAGAQFNMASMPRPVASAANAVTGLSLATIVKVPQPNTADVAYGFQPEEIIDVSVAEDITTTQDFALTPLDTFVVSGTVSDATTGWPLYASIDIEADGYAADPVWTDPVSGYYSVTLAGGTVYAFTVEAWVNGYDAGVRAVGPLTADSTEDFALDADRGICTAPGYAPTDIAYSEKLEASDGGYSGEVDWEWGTPASWPFDCASGSNCWGTNLSGDYSANTDQTLTSTVISLAAYPMGTILTARWWQATDMESGFDYASAEININAGGWEEIWSSSSTDNDWTPVSYDISAAAGGTVQFRWRITTDGAVEKGGYYVDDVEIIQGCAPASGGLVVGNVYDAATNSPQVGAIVSNDSGRSTTTVATPLDAAVDDAFYTLFSPTASHVFTATAGYGLGADVQTVGVVMGDTVRRDFYLPDASFYVVSGTVRDSNTGWPLYASIDIAGYPGDPFWNDPVSGYYSVTLAEGTPFDFIATPWVEGYETASVPVAPLSGDKTQDIAVDVDPVRCNAPGYAHSATQLFEDFDDVTFPPTGWTLYSIDSSPSQDWHRYEFTPGVGAARHVWNTSEHDDDWLVTPQIANLPANASLAYWEVDPNPLGAFYDEHNVMITTDADPDPNTATYTLLREADAETSWTFIHLDLSAYAGQDAYLAFNYRGFGTDVWYVDDVHVFESICITPAGGGLVVGHVYDANTSLPINGATVTDEDGYSALTGLTPDPAVDEAFYTIFSPAGSKTFTATTTIWGYEADVHPAVGVVADDTVGLEIFNLPAGALNYSPSGLSVTVREGMSTTVPLMLSNAGSVSIDFNLVEQAPSSNPTTVMSDPFRSAWAPGSLHAYGEPALGKVQNPRTPLAPGDVLASWDTGLAYARSAAYDRLNGTVWVNSPCADWDGECKIVEYATDGTPTGRWYAYDWNVIYGPADMVYNPNTGMIWVVDVGQDDCIHELDPDSGWTGDRICGFASDSMRGLAYNPDTDTYYTGRDPYDGCPPEICNTVFEFTGETWGQPGTVIESQNIGFGFEGLAYHPDAGSLFFAEYLTDRVHEYDLAWTKVSSFTVSGLTALGMDIDCHGNLWMSDGNTGMLLVDSNHPADLCPGLDWLSEDPTTGTIGVAPATSSIAVTFDAGAPSVTRPGEYTGTLRVNNTSPYGSVQIPVTMTVVAPEAAWEKAVWVSGERLTDTLYRGLLLDDTITIADRVWITYTDSITFTLVEQWSESLALESWERTADDVVVGSGMLTWTLEDGTPNAWHVLTKTYGVVSGAWTVDYITETLTVDGALTQPIPITLEFQHAVFSYLPIILRNQ